MTNETVENDGLNRALDSAHTHELQMQRERDAARAELALTWKRVEALTAALIGIAHGDTCATHDGSCNGCIARYALINDEGQEMEGRYEAVLHMAGVKRVPR